MGMDIGSYAHKPCLDSGAKVWVAETTDSLWTLEP